MEHINIILLTVFYVIPILTCLYNRVGKKKFYSGNTFLNICLVIFCFIPIYNFYETFRIVFRIQRDFGDLRIYLLIIGMFFSGFYLSSPDKIVVNENAEIECTECKFQSLIQGKRFWQNQHELIERKLKWELTEPTRQTKIKAKLAQASKDIKLAMEKYYRENPDKRLSTTQLETKELEEKSYQIERKQVDQVMERERLIRIERLKKLLLIVQAKIDE